MADDRNLDRLRQVVASYGCDPERWPSDERADLEPLGRAWRDAPWMIEQRELDQLLDTVPGARMRVGLAGDIVAAARLTPRADPERVVVLFARLPARRFSSNLLARSGPATFLAASLLAGLWLGATDKINSLVDGEPLGLSELAPGVSGETSLSFLVLDALSNDMSLP